MLSTEQKNSGTDLALDLVLATIDQLQEDGSYRTPDGRADERARILTEKYRGTSIMAKVIESGFATITKRDCYQNDGDGNLDLVRFDFTEGDVEYVSPAHGGFIELTDGTCISFNSHGQNGSLPEGYKLGLELNVIE
jgi:hypothetical protein